MFKELDVVKLKTAQTDAGLAVGAVGTVLEVLRGGACLVEFANDQGETLAILPLASDRLTSAGAATA